MTARSSGPSDKSKGLLISLRMHSSSFVSWSAGESCLRSINEKGTAILFKITCLGSPSSGLKTVRNTSCRSTILLSARFSNERCRGP